MIMRTVVPRHPYCTGSSVYALSVLTIYRLHTIMENDSLLTGRYLDKIEDVLLMIHLFTMLANCTGGEDVR